MYENTVEDVVLSDVHIYATFTPIKEGKFALSRFHFDAPESYCTATQINDILEPEIDEDGDILVQRSQKNNEIQQNVITIEHSLATPISNVGTQVWRGSLLLCDFLVHNEEKFDSCISLELGGGVGLCSIVLSRVAKKVFCTDIRDVLNLCEENVFRNRDLFKHSKSVIHESISLAEWNCQAGFADLFAVDLDIPLASSDSVTVVRELDFFHSSRVLDSMECSDGWTENDKGDLRRLSVIIASDVIYDDRLTDAFLHTVEKLFELNPSAVLYISLERRINFTLQDLEMVSPSYDYFMQKLQELTSKKQPAMIVEKQPTEFPQYFKYDRVKQLELWKIQCDVEIDSYSST